MCRLILFIAFFTTGSCFEVQTKLFEAGISELKEAFTKQVSSLPRQIQDGVTIRELRIANVRFNVLPRFINVLPEFQAYLGGVEIEFALNLEIIYKTSIVNILLRLNADVRTSMVLQKNGANLVPEFYCEAGFDLEAPTWFKVAIWVNVAVGMGYTALENTITSYVSSEVCSIMKNKGRTEFGKLINRLSTRMAVPNFDDAHVDFQLRDISFDATEWKVTHSAAVISGDRAVTPWKAIDAKGNERKINERSMFSMCTPIDLLNALIKATVQSKIGQNFQVHDDNFHFKLPSEPSSITGGLPPVEVNIVENDKLLLIIRGSADFPDEIFGTWTDVEMEIKATVNIQVQNHYLVFKTSKIIWPDLFTMFATKEKLAETTARVERLMKNINFQLVENSPHMELRNEKIVISNQTNRICLFSDFNIKA